MNEKITIQGLSLRFQTDAGTVEALRDISLTVREGEFVCLIGPSGCGKSTLLNVIAGLVDAPPAQIEGRIDIRRRRADEPLGYVFQKDTLLPWRTLEQNVGVGLEVRGVSRAHRTARVCELIHLMGLIGFETALPHQLSGGMRQRASIARSLAYEPEVILMDEPFGALDAQTRLVLQQELLTIWEKTRKTILFVTHDLGEAVTLGERVVLMTPRPGTIRAIYPIDIPMPRLVFDLRGREDYLRHHQMIWQELRKEIPVGRP